MVYFSVYYYLFSIISFTTTNVHVWVSVNVMTFVTAGRVRQFIDYYRKPDNA